MNRVSTRFTHIASVLLIRSEHCIRLADNVHSGIRHRDLCTPRLHLRVRIVCMGIMCINITLYALEIEICILHIALTMIMLH